MTYPQRRMTGALISNTLLERRYRVVRPVGKGGFGAVYEARDERFQARVVAIKEMSDAQLSSKDRAQAIQDFRQEANMLVQLRHPNLPDVSDFFEEGGKAYLVMEYIEGDTLEKIQENANGPLNEQQVMIWGYQLCNVLGYLHTRPHPVIFRDMKPSNVMVDKDGQIKLIDFGIARIFKSTAAKDTASLGSRGYAPPEQYGRGQTDARSDLYALGATLYDLLTKSTPTDSVTRLVNKSAYEPPRQLNPSISPATEQIVVRAMELDPSQRFQTAFEMRDAIVVSGVVPSQVLQGIPSGPISGGTGLHPVPPTWSGTSTMQVPSGAALAVPPAPSAPQAVPGQFQQMQQPSPPKKHTRRNILIGLGAVGVAAAGAVVLSGLLPHKNNGTGGNGGSGGPTITTYISFSTEKTQWLAAAINAYNKANNTLNRKNLQVQQLSASGSVNLVDAIVNPVAGQTRPALWSPASTVEVNQLSTLWQQKYPAKPSIIPSSADLAPTSVAYSPLVFAVKNDFVSRIQQYGKIDWASLHSVITSKSDNVNFGHTRPDQSNSGLLSIILIAYDHYKKTRGLTVNDVKDQGFLAYMSDFEGAINQYGRSSDGFYSNCVLNPVYAYQITTIYENLVLMHQNRDFSIFYPSTNMISDHPFVILQADDVTSEQQQAAKVFRDFLKQDQQQRLALTFGLRPLSQNITLADSVAGNVFKTYEQSSNGKIQRDLPTQVAYPDYNVTNELLNQWKNLFGSKITASC